MYTLRTRIFGAVAALGFAAMAVVAPMAAQAKSIAGTQTIFDDVHQLQAQINNSQYIAQIALACELNAATRDLHTICTNLLNTEVTTIDNASQLIFDLVGTWPNSGTLTAGQQTQVTFLSHRANFTVTVNGHKFFNQSNFVAALDRDLEDGAPGAGAAFPHAITGSAICAGIGFMSSTRSYCASLENTSDYEFNVFQDYVTSTQGNL